MNRNVDLTPELPRHDAGRMMILVDARLKKLRRERRLVQRAIQVLSEISRSRQSILVARKPRQKLS